MDSPGVHRPRNLDWKRAAALLYGDWGTSKAYVIGLAFVAAGFSSFPIILAVCALTGIVGYNYILVCKNFPDGGGVYSAARTQSRLLAVMGALLLVADLTVTAALSGWAAMSYFAVPKVYLKWATMGLIVFVGAVNYFGPKHSGNLALSLALPTVIVVVLIVAFSIPYLNLGPFDHFRASGHTLEESWVNFVKVILALSGVESIANLTGVMKLDPGSTMEKPQVGQTSRRGIIPVALEVVLGTTLLGWAMLSVPTSLAPQLRRHYEDMLRFLADHYGSLVIGASFGHIFGAIVGVIVGLLLLSAVNTAIAALIGLTYLMARDGEMPRGFTRLNAHGVPWVPMIIATCLPFVVLSIAHNLESLADLYAIGVVGAISVNLGSCTFNAQLGLKWFERGIMAVTFVVLCLVELTIAKTKPNALFFAVCVVGAGLALRAYAQRRAGLRTVTVSKEIAAAVAPESSTPQGIELEAEQAILVAARGFTPVLKFALEEARLRKALLYVLYVKELAVTMPGSPVLSDTARWKDDPQASRIMYKMFELARQSGVTVVPLFAVSDDPAAAILDLAATLGTDFLVLGASHRHTLAGLLKGDVVTHVARNLPENINLVIFG